MIKNAFEKMARIAFRKSIDWITPDMSACVCLNDFEEKLGLRSMSPVQEDAYHRQECQNLLELGMKFNPLNRTAKTDIFLHEAGRPCVIRSQYTSLRTGTPRIAVMIYDPTHSRDEYRPHHIQPLFGISGTIVAHDTLAITRIVLPQFHCMAFNGSIVVSDRRKTLSAALDFGGRCISQINAGNALFLYSNYVDAGLKTQPQTTQLAASGMNP